MCPLFIFIKEEKMTISLQKIQDDMAACIAKFAGMAITAIIDGETITSAVMQQSQKKTNELLDEGESNEVERWVRFNHDDLTAVPTPNESTCTISSVVYTITEVVEDSVKATMRVKLADQYADY